MHALAADPRLASVDAERWERAQRIVDRGWLRGARADGRTATATCSGLVDVRVLLEVESLRSACDCGGAQPCEHALALAIHVGSTVPTWKPPAPAPAAPAPAPAAPEATPAPAVGLCLASDPADPGALVLRGDVPAEAAERLRWIWWQRRAPDLLAGEARTLAQACQLLAELRLDVGAAAERAELAGALAQFRQRALGDPVHVRLLDPASEGALALAKMLADRGGAPYPGRLPAEWWTLPDQSAFAGFFLEAWRRGARVRAELSLDPKPLAGIEAQMDVGCLPARLVLSAPADAQLRALLKGEPALDAATGHVLVPAARVLDVEEGLRALGADVCYRRLAPPGARYLEWAEELPEDLHGARPRLREPFRGALAERPPGLRETTLLAPYQQEALAFIAHHGHTCLLADDMGLGKTLEAIAAAQLVDGRVLVVCPASARQVWAREVAKFTTEAATLIGPGDPVIASDAKYTITGYSNLEHVAEALDVSRFALVVLDESHYVKNAGTGRAKLVKERLAAIPRRLVISGTPVMNAPEEMRAQLAFLHPEEWGDVRWFRARFSEPFEGGTPEVREAILKRLRQFLDGIMLRREKSEALPDLPPKSILWHRVKLAPEARRAYVALEDEFDAVARAEGVTSAKAAGKLERLKQCALSGKLPEALAFVRRVVEGGEKVVLFSRYRDAMTSAAGELADLGPVTLSGDSSSEERAEAERRFQEDPTCRVFIGQIVAAGTALTLIAGTHAVFLDLSWNPADHRQAMDRIHRRGQTKPVFAHFFLAEGTVDEEIAAVLDAKGQMMDALLSGGGKQLKGTRREVGERLLSRRGRGSPAVPLAPPAGSSRADDAGHTELSPPTERTEPSGGLRALRS